MNPSRIIYSEKTKKTTKVKKQPNEPGFSVSQRRLLNLKHNKIIEEGTNYTQTKKRKNSFGNILELKDTTQLNQYDNENKLEIDQKLVNRSCNNKNRKGTTDEKEVKLEDKTINRCSKKTNNQMNINNTEGQLSPKQKNEHFEIEEENGMRNRNTFGIDGFRNGGASDSNSKNKTCLDPKIETNDNGVDNLVQEKPNLLLEDQELYYDYPQIDFNFTDEELKDEPAPETMWIHMSCLYWIPEIFFDNSVSPLEPKNIKAIEKDKFKSVCSVCNRAVGVCVKCVNETCDVKFHVECARKANIHLEMIIEHTTKFIIHCPQHTTKLVYNLIQSEHKKTQEEIIKFYKYLQRFAKSNNVNIASEDLIEYKTLEKIKPRSVSSISEVTEVSDNDNETITLNHFGKPDISVLAKFMPNQSKLHFARIRKLILTKKEDYRFVINLKRVSSDDQYRVLNETNDMAYKNEFINHAESDKLQSLQEEDQIEQLHANLDQTEIKHANDDLTDLTEKINYERCKESVLLNTTGLGINNSTFMLHEVQTNFKNIPQTNHKTENNAISENSCEVQQKTDELNFENMSNTELVNLEKTPGPKNEYPILESVFEIEEQTEDFLFFE